MAGGMFAGHDESGGELVEQNGKFFKKFYGMSSSEAMDRYSGGVNSYRASEGKLVYLPAKGPIEYTVMDLLGGIRSTCTYVGAHSLEQLPEKTKFIRVSQ
jgi:GMP reductase